MEIGKIVGIGHAPPITNHSTAITKHPVSFFYKSKKQEKYSYASA
jgi:hypothetical protein